ncbi:MAG: PIN domain-containing protein [Mycobacteriales bacterium]
MARRRVVSPGSLLLDSEGLVKLALGASNARAYFESARARQARVAVSALTLTEVLRGKASDAAIHRVLTRIVVVAVTPELARQAGELLGSTGLSGHSHAIDAVVAATALALEGPVMLLTSDPKDLARLVGEATRSGQERVTVVHV